MRVEAWPWVAVLLLVAGAARAEISGTLALLSDDRYRGASLTAGRPAVQASVAYEHPAGPYAGALVSNVHLSNDFVGTRGLLYAGYTHPLVRGYVWDVGGLSQRLPMPDMPPRYDYTEWYIGLGDSASTVRLFHSNDFYGLGTHSWYAEANRTIRIDGRYQLSAHLGYRVIVQAGLGPAHGVDGSRLDYRAGLGVDVSGFLVEVSLVGTNRTTSQCPLENGYCTATVVLSVARNF